MTFLLQDLRYTLRMLRKSPVFTAVAVLVVALGIAATTAIFSVANALLRRPVPGIAAPGSVVDVIRSDSLGRGFHSTSYPLYRDLRDGTPALSGLAAYGMGHLVVSPRPNAQGSSAVGQYVSGNYFTVLGVRPALGRFFLPEEDSIPGAHPVAVLGNALWRNAFGADPSVVGRVVQVNGHALTVVGIAPPDFGGTVSVLSVDIWVPMMMEPALRGRDLLANRGASWLQLVGRLAPGATPLVASAELTTVARRAAQEHPAYDADLRFRAAPLRPLLPQMMALVTAFMAILLGVSGLVLAIASVNVASMLLARAAARRREMVVRVALGAGRPRLVRQLLTETVVLFTLGGLAGVALAAAAVRVLARLHPNLEVPVTLTAPVDGLVLAVGLGVAMATGLTFGLLPALQATRTALADALRAESAGAGARRARARSVLVTAQLALSLLLLFGAGLFLRALQRGQTIDPGFSTGHVALATLDLGSAGYTAARADAFWEQLAARVRPMPDVRAMGLTRMVPLDMSSMAAGVTVDGVRSRDGRPDVMVEMTYSGPGYLGVLRLPLLHGRDFTPRDLPGAPHVAIATRGFVRRFWGDVDGVGRRFRIDSTTYEIVGVTRDARFVSLGEEPRPFLFLPAAQAPGTARAMTLAVRTAGDPAALEAPLAAAVRALDPALPPPHVQTLREATTTALLPQRIASLVTGVLGLTGLALAAVGLYGVIAYSVSQRTRELGVRIALGATRRDIVGMVVRDGARLAAAGTIAGLAMGVMGTRALAAFLFGVSPLDPLILLGMPLAMWGVAMLASYLPARRAAAVDAMAALRAE